MLLWCCWKQQPSKLTRQLCFTTNRRGAERGQEDVFWWNVRMRAYVVHKENETAIQLYCQMVGSGVEADNFTFPCVIKACGSLGGLHLGKGIHAHLLQKGFHSDAFVVTQRREGVKPLNYIG